MYGYNIHGDAIMRDVSLPGPAESASLHCVDMNLALDKLIPKFSPLFLVDPPIHRVPDDLLYELFMTLVGDLPYQSCDLAVRMSQWNWFDESVVGWERADQSIDGWGSLSCKTRESTPRTTFISAVQQLGRKQGERARSTAISPIAKLGLGLRKRRLNPDNTEAPRTIYVRNTSCGAHWNIQKVAISGH
ncbi:hypothetical protein B0H13DRAFT_1871950 [Mycena leptocephala]|nr:hypothetical protein B0H13DRAFT_1871950 [Mycena leptocephala]